MVSRKIKWTLRAIKEREQILDYWYFRNKSILYPEKLNKLLMATIDLIAVNPEVGKIFNKRMKIYFLLLKSYRIYYVFNDRDLIVLSIWDTRRNPSKFKKIQ